MISFIITASILIILISNCSSLYMEEDSDEDSSEENPFQPRIAGGRPSKVGDIPYHVQIRYMDEYICGGALVLGKEGNQVIVTGGQCVTHKSTRTDLLEIEKLSVIAGRVRINGIHVYEQFRSVVHVERHAQWKRTYSLYYYDIALIHLNRPFALNNMIQPIALPWRAKTDPVGKIVITGWGHYNTAEMQMAEYLQIGSLKMIGLKECKEIYDPIITAKVSSYNFCAGTVKNPTYQGGCIGDTGSPAVALYNDTPYLAGTYNWGRPKCGNRYQPSIFNDISHYLDWIDRYAKPRTLMLDPSEISYDEVEFEKSDMYDYGSSPARKAKPLRRLG